MPIAANRILYGYWRSSAAYRVRLALAVKALSYASKPIDLRTGAQTGIGFTMLNPQGLVPYLIDGDIGLNQSLAIIEYLDEAYPAPPLLPADAIGRARVRAAALTIACDIHPLNNLRVLNYLKGPLGVPPESVDLWVEHWIAAGFAALEETAANSKGRYLFGDSVTLADICLVPQMYNARRIRADLTPFPALISIDKRLNALASFRNARPEAQPDAA
ncbi:MAG: maleylacetoacetate isomerase [Polymorphobacter sp.]